MKIWQRIITYGLWIIATTLSFITPMIILFNQLVIEHYDVVKARISFGIAFLLVVVMVIGIVVLKAWYKRKLQSIDVANELGIVGTTPVIIKRLLLLFQIAFPLIAVALLLYGISYIEIPSYSIFLNYLWWFLGGFMVYVIHDYTKYHFLNRNLIEKALKLDDDKEKLAIKIEEKKIKIRRKKRDVRYMEDRGKK